MPLSARTLALSLSIATLAAILWHMGASDPANAQAQPPAAPPVTVAPPDKKQVTDKSEFTGQFQSVDFVEVRARVSGYLTEIRFTDGQMVEKGDVLFVIDPRPYEAALAQARARAEQASSSKQFATRQLARAGELQRAEVASQSLLDQRESESKGASAATQAAIAAVREAELNLQYTRVTAPVSGRISARQISIGNLVSAGGNNGSGTLLTTIASQDPLYLWFDLSEADYLTFARSPAAKRNSQGELDVTVELRLMDEKGWPRQGRLTFVDNQLDKSSGTIRARATVPNSDQLIPPGAFARIRMPMSAPYDALLVPDAALVTDQSRRLVMTVAPDGTVVPKVINEGPLLDGQRVIRSGLSPDDQVIVNGLMRARPGAKVTPQKADAAPAPDAKKAG